jgi:predicted nucleotidyltransferase
MRFVVHHSLSQNTSAVVALAKEWKISRLSVFGSAIRDDFREDSDIDLLVEFEPSARYSLIDLVYLKTELERILGRPVDIVEPAALTNPYRRKHILETAQLLYAA